MTSPLRSQPPMKFGLRHQTPEALRRAAARLLYPPTSGGGTAAEPRDGRDSTSGRLRSSINVASAATDREVSTAPPRDEGPTLVSINRREPSPETLARIQQVLLKRRQRMEGTTTLTGSEGTSPVRQSEPDHKSLTMTPAGGASPIARESNASITSSSTPPFAYDASQNMSERTPHRLGYLDSATPITGSSATQDRSAYRKLSADAPRESEQPYQQSHSTASTRGFYADPTSALISHSDDGGAPRRTAPSPFLPAKRTAQVQQSPANQRAAEPLMSSAALYELTTSRTEQEDSVDLSKTESRLPTFEYTSPMRVQGHNQIHQASSPPLLHTPTVQREVSSRSSDSPPGRTAATAGSSGAAAFRLNKSLQTSFLFSAPDGTNTSPPAVPASRTQTTAGHCQPSPLRVADSVTAWRAPAVRSSQQRSSSVVKRVSPPRDDGGMSGATATLMETMMLLDVAIRRNHLLVVGGSSSPADPKSAQKKEAHEIGIERVAPSMAASSKRSSESSGGVYHQALPQRRSPSPCIDPPSGTRFLESQQHLLFVNNRSVRTSTLAGPTGAKLPHELESLSRNERQAKPLRAVGTEGFSKSPSVKIPLWEPNSHDKRSTHSETSAPYAQPKHGAAERSSSGGTDIGDSPRIVQQFVTTDSRERQPFAVAKPVHRRHGASDSRHCCVEAPAPREAAGLRPSPVIVT